jgi:hypothetical protein
MNSAYGMGMGMGMYPGAYGSENQGSYSGYQSQGSYGQMYATSSYGSETQSSSEGRSLGRYLTAGGIPNDDGRIRWPIGLKILGRTVSDDLGERLNALFLIEAAEAANGRVDANVSAQIKKNIKEFRDRVFKDKNERLGLPYRVYDEAEDFLDKLANADKVLQAGLGSLSRQN